MEKIVKIKDEKIITKILNNAFLTVAREFGYTKEIASNFNAFINSDRIKKQMENGLKMYGFIQKNTIIGCIGYSFNKDNEYFIERFAVLPEYRHLGIGKILLECIENKIKNNKGEIIGVHIFDNNIKLKEWYKKLGYKETKVVEENDYVPFKLYVMNKNI